MRYLPLTPTDRADMLGMSQLYQIRGRVGRSSRSAHAYLFYPSARELSEEDEGELEASASTAPHAARREVSATPPKMPRARRRPTIVRTS